MFLKIFMILIFMNSMMFFIMSTPLSMGLILLMQTLLIALMSGMMSFNFWYTYILFLIMLGGMLILFIYVSSLSSNQKFSINKNSFFIFILMILMIISMIYNLNYFLTFNSDLMNMLNLNIESNYLLKMSMNKLYNTPTNFIMMMMINYLLLTLFIVVKITNISMGPLRKNL